MLKKIIKKIIIFIVIMIIMWVIVLGINIARCINFKEPITFFAIDGLVDETGGEYIYPGYSIEVHTNYMGPVYEIKMKFLNITVFEKKAEEIQTNRKLENAKIEVLKDSITEDNITIVITDTNKYSYDWYGEYEIENYETWKRTKIEKKLKDYEISARDGNNQITISFDLSKVYEQLSPGTYRIVKEVFDKSHGFMDIDSNEFEIIK